MAPYTRKLLGCIGLKTDTKTVGKHHRFMTALIVLITLAISTIVLTSDIFAPSKLTSFHIILNGNRKQVSGIFKRAYENSDGSVDVVFNIPVGAQDLVRVNVTDTGIDREVLPTLKHKNTTRNTTMVRTKPSQSSARMAYPLTLDRDYVINSPGICRKGQPIDYLIMVHSATAYFDRRQAMRHSFAARGLFRNIHQSIVFLLGLTDDMETTTKIRREALNYGDIVQGDFIDSYHNLTHKGVMGYRWIVEHCPQARLILKVDDDTFVNPFRLVKNLFPLFENKTRQIACHVRPRDTSLIVRGGGKWHVSEDEFKGLSHYPFPYCNGYFVLMSAEIMRPMFQAVRLNPFFWIDDVYLFGLLPATVGNVNFLNIRENLTLQFNTARDCIASHGLNCRYLACAEWRKGQGTTLWQMLMELVPESVKKAYSLFAKS